MKIGHLAYDSLVALEHCPWGHITADEREIKDSAKSVRSARFFIRMLSSRIEQRFRNSESEPGDSPSEVDDVDDKRDKKGS